MIQFQYKKSTKKPNDEKNNIKNNGEKKNQGPLGAIIWKKKKIILVTNPFKINTKMSYCGPKLQENLINEDKKGTQK